MTLTAKSVVAVDKKDLSLERVLEEMKVAGAKGELLLATHSVPSGFKMRIAKGSQASAQLSVLEKILEIGRGVQQRAAIKAMVESKRPAAWKDWFRKYEPGIKLEGDIKSIPGWENQVEQWYREWYARQGSQILKLQNPNKDLPRLLGLVQDVQRLSFKRLELRACRIGKDSSALQTLADFFNVTKVVAPKDVRTFFGVIARIEIEPNRKRLAALQKRLGTRTFPGVRMVLSIMPKTFRVVAADQNQARLFVQKLILPGFSGSVTPFVIGGLEPARTSKVPGKAHVFPQESEYNKLLALLDTSAPGP